MKAYVLTKTGAPRVLSIQEVVTPRAGPGQVRVALQYVGLNYAEVLSRKGLYGWAPPKPYILGMEGSGVIDEVGSGVDSSRLGERVIVGTQLGCYAEKLVVPEAQALPAIDSYDMAENAAFLVNYMTAWVALFPLARLQRGEALLVSAAAGGVGTAAVQLASRHGCRVYGLAGSREKIRLVESLGAARGFNYREPGAYDELRTESGGLDVVLELVGGESYRQTLSLLNPFGRMVIAGLAGLQLQRWNPLSWWRVWRDLPRVDLRWNMRRSLAVMATHLGYLLDDRARVRGLFDELRSFVTEHGIRPVVGRVFPFAQAGEAHQFIESRQSTGKVLLQL